MLDKSQLHHHNGLTNGTYIRTDGQPEIKYDFPFLPTIILNPDFLIIGGGIIGLATAFRLARQGAQVAIAERGAIGAESSWAGGGILSPLLPWQYPVAVTALCELSVARYPAWIDALQASSGLDAEFWRCGMLVLPPFDASAAQAWCHQHNWQSELLAAHTYLPHLSNIEALWLPTVAQVRNPRLIKSLRAAVVAQGVKLLEHTPIAAIKGVQHQLQYVDTHNGKLHAGNFVVCAGAWSQGLLSSYPPAKTIKPMRGQMLLFKAAPGLLTHIVYQQGIYLIPRRDGHILVGSTVEDVGYDKSTTPDTRQTLTHTAYELLPALRAASLIQHWSGLRPGSPENVPTIARHPQLENLYVNAGHYRYGVTMAPASADLLAELIFKQQASININEYQWDNR